MKVIKCLVIGQSVHKFYINWWIACLHQLQIHQEHLSIAKFEEELRKSEKFNHIFVDNITREEKDNNTVYKFNIKILTKDVDFNEEQK